MTNFKQYLRSHMKSSFRSFIYILVAVIVLSLVIGLSDQPTYDYDPQLEQPVRAYTATLYIPILFMSILAYAIPVMEFSFFKKRINLDCAYSLPISRRAMGAVHYITGLIMLLGAYTASYLTNFVLLLSRGPGHFDFLPMIPHYFLTALLGFCMYSVMVFVFNEANTKGDGIWFMVLYTFIFYLITGALLAVTDSSVDHIFVTVPWGVIDKLKNSYELAIENISVKESFFWQSPMCIAFFIFWVVAGIASTAGLLTTFGKRRMERTEEISDSYFGYRVLIPTYAVGGMIAFAGLGALTWIIIEILAFLGYTIYRRGFHYKRSDIIILLSLIVFLFIDL